MKTNIADNTLTTADNEHANRILRSCVHCGFCNATCPTYQVLGDELDGPRGRIYLIKQVMEGKAPTEKTQLHLDRCLTCRNCESTCPSGVDYSHLLNLGRELVNRKVRHSVVQRTQHYLLRKLFLSRRLFSAALKAGQLLKPVLPAAIKKSVPDTQKKVKLHSTSHRHKILLVSGCVQPSLKPNIDVAAQAVFDQLGIACVEPETTQCCGSLSHHLNASKEALDIMRSNIDHWLELITYHDIKAICMTASGCGIAIKEYAQLLESDPDYAEKARTISAMYKDPAEIISEALHREQNTGKRLRQMATPGNRKIAFHPPCTLQHGMQLNNLVEVILRETGFSLVPFRESHLCCGSAGTYSITQKAISQQLLHRKLDNIEATQADVIATANIGCQLHLQSGTSTPVKHWLELFI